VQGRPKPSAFKVQQIKTKNVSPVRMNTKSDSGQIKETLKQTGFEALDFTLRIHNSRKKLLIH
jgi:hypothetical protein